jgi:hypothetical protein
MGQLQKVSWRVVGYAALGTVVAAASVVAIVNSDGVRPTSLMSSAATRWLVDQNKGNVVLVDGLAGRVVAKIDAEARGSDEVAVQGAGGAFLVAPRLGSVRTISTAKLQLGTAKPVALLSESGAKFGVGASGLTILSPQTNEASVVAVDDVSRPIKVPESVGSRIAGDGSMWLFGKTDATHVNVDQTRSTMPLRSTSTYTTTVGAHAVLYDSKSRVVRWLDGGDVSIDTVPNASEAVLQEPGDDASCVWLGVGDRLFCVGATGIDRTVGIAGMNIASGDRLAVAGTAAVVVRANTNRIDRIDLEGKKMGSDDQSTVPASTNLTITAAGDLIWLDEQTGNKAFVVHRFGINIIDKADETAPQLDAQGQIQTAGDGETGDSPGNGASTSGDDETKPLDNNGHDDPPIAVDDSVTARADTTITVPVTGNDYDPDGDAIAVVEVGVGRSPGHGTTDLLDGTSVTYLPNPGYSGSDSFDYTIVDENGNTDTAIVNVQLFPPDSPNQPPIARPDHVKTRLGKAITIDVLANDIDPERDELTVSAFRQNGTATITDTIGPTRLPALKYDPPDTPGIYTFTYQAADPQGGLSQKTLVTVEVLGADAPNEPPVAQPDAIRLPVGVEKPLDVKANDVDPDGDDLTIELKFKPPGVNAVVRSQRLAITLTAGAAERSVILYTLSDGDPTHDQVGRVLVLRIDDAASNRPPVANADTERVVIGNAVKIPVTSNDVDPDSDDIRLLSAGRPADGAGTTLVEGNSVRFTPTLADITEPTPVIFYYTISDGHGNEATGRVTVTVLVEPLPRAPFARDDFADTVKDKPVNIDVLANDSDPSGGRPTLDADATCANGGTAKRTADDHVAFVPPQGATGTFRCKYTVSNSQGLKAEASIIVTVTDAPLGNHEPTIDSANTQKIVNVGGTITLNANDIGNDADGDSLVFASVSKPGHGTTNFSQTNETFAYTAPSAGTADKTPDADSITVLISDQHDGNVPGTISIKIIDDTPPASTPPLTHEIQKSGLAGDTVLVDVVTELRDQNSTTTLTLTGASADSGPGTAQVVGGVVSIVTTGPGTVLVTYTVANAAGITAPGTIKLTISEPPLSNPPVAVDDVLIIPSGGVNSVDLLANDSGIDDPGDKVQIVLNNRPPTSFGSVQVSNGTLTFTAADDAAGNATIRYTLSDGSGESDDATVSLTVQQCSESPPSVRAASAFTPYQTPINIDLNQYVVSGSIRPGSVSGAGLTGPTGVYTPPQGMNGTENVTFTVENGCHQSTPGLLTIDVNHSPIGDSISRNLSRGGPPLILNVTEFASDDEPLNITALTGNPSWATLVFGSNGKATTIHAAPPSNTLSGTYAFTATVQDTGGLTATATISLTINNLAPTAVDDAYVTQASQITFDPTSNDTDPEGQPLTIQAASWISGPGTIVGYPNNQITVSSLGQGVTVLSYTIRDDGGLTSSATVTITASTPNRAPTLPDASGATNGTSTAHVTLTPTDLDGDQLAITCDVGSTGFMVQITEVDDSDPVHPVFDLEVTVPGDFAGSKTIHCKATDSHGAESSQNTVTIAVIDF